MDFTSQHSAGGADQPEIVVAWQALIGEEFAFADGRVVGALKDGGGFVDLVKYGLVYHRSAAFDRTIILLPEKLTLAARYLVEFAFGEPVVPTKAKPDYGQILFASFLAPSIKS